MLRTIQVSLKRYSDANGPLLAAALAYFSVFSLAPFLVIVIAVFVFFGAGNAQGTVLAIVSQVVGEEGAAIVRTMIDGQARQGGGAFATVTSVAIVLFAATTLFFQLKRTLDTLWGTATEPKPGLGGVKALVSARARALGLILSIGLLLLLALFLSTVVSTAISAVGDVLPGGPGPWRTLNLLVAFGALVVVFGLTFRLLPNATAPWRAIAIGSLVTAALVVLFTWLFGVYISSVAVAGAYGAAGSLVVLLLWVFFSAQVVLVGASVTRTLAWDDREET